MKLLFSVPTGYHLRELLLPLQSWLQNDTAISQVIVLTPAADSAAELFPNFSNKFLFLKNPDTLDGHIQLLQSHQPNLVMTDTVGHDERDYPIIKAAQASSIPSLTFVASWDNVWKIERLLKTPNRVALADNFIVWNQMMHDHLLRIFPQLKPEQVKIIGAPRFDYYSHADKIPTKAELFNTLNLTNPQAPLIHFSTTELYPMDYIAEAVKMAMDAGQLPKDLVLLATVHPGGKLANHSSLEKYGVAVRFAFGHKENITIPGFTYNPTEADIYNSVALYKHTSVLINHSSTTALESLLADVPVINIKYGQPLDWWRWYRSMVYRDFQQHYRDVVSDGATKVVKNKGQLISTMKTYLQHPEEDKTARAQTIAKMITTVDGTASQQVSDIIKSQAR